MNRKPRGGFTSDEGMSIVEVVIASFILFFVLTAIIGLVWTTTEMGVNAKQRSAATNVMTSHMEWIRSLTFDEVAIQGTETSAAIPAQRTRTIEGFTVVLTTTVTDGGSGVKEVQVDAVASGPGYPTLRMSQHASIRDYKSGLTSVSTNTGLRVRFGYASPPEDTVVYSAYYGNNSLLYIDADVDVQSSNPDTVITELKFTCSGNMLRDGSTIHANVAYWQPMTSSTSQRIRWNTEQVDNEGNPDAIPDGWRLIRVEATDSEGNPPVAVERRLLVDNDPPGVPGDCVSQVMSDREVRLGWTSARDGTDDAWEYGIKIHKVSASGTPVLVNSSDAYGNPVDFKLSPSAFIHSSTNPPASPATAFSRYLASVRAYSPRLLTSDYVEILPQGWTEGATKAYVTKPLLTGSSFTLYTGKSQLGTRAASTKATVSVTPPTFGCYSIRYDLYRGTSPTSLVLFKSDIGPTYLDSIYKFLGTGTTPPTYYYQYKISYVPMGETAGSSGEVILSNIVGPTNIGETAMPLPQVDW